MAIFGNEEIAAERARAEKYKNQILKMDAERKKLAADLAAEQQRCAQLQNQLQAMQVVIEEARTAVREARRMRKASAQRVKRIKAQRAS